MPLDLDALLAPKRCALVVHECQRGVVGDLAGIPGLAASVRNGMLESVSALARAGRAAGVPIIHCTAVRRADGRGANANARLFQHMRRVDHPLVVGSPAAEIVPEIAVEESDIVLPRLHGLSSFHGTGLDPILRNLGAVTLVGVGVSVNVAIQNFAFDAVNNGYQVVLPRDAVAGFPESYVDAVFEHTLTAITTVTHAKEVQDIWRRTTSI